jgi:uncharacterized phage protein gp47/JayE
MEVSDLVFINSAGYHYEDYASFAQYFEDKYKDIYGADVYLGDDSQDGQLLKVFAQAVFDTAVLGASTYNSFAPTTAQGVGLSRNVKINGLRRQSASKSTVELVIGGMAFKSIIAGIAIDDLDQQWALPASVTIPITGTITVTATAVEEGALAAEAGTVTGIFTPTDGWQTVNNPAAATAGQAVETDAALRSRQARSTSIPAQTVFEATVGAVANIPGVLALSPYENDTDIADSNGLPPHSISLVVEGATDTEIAETILDYKTPGTNTYGTTEVPLTDSKGVPITIRFFRPTQHPIAVKVTLTPLASWVSTNTDIIAAAIAEYINAIPIGGSIILTKLYAIAYVSGTVAAGSFNIESIELAEQSTGAIHFTGTTTDGDTLTVNGTAFTFKNAPSGPTEILVGATAAETAENTQAILAASTDTNVEKATYSLDGAYVNVLHKQPGPDGDTFTLAKSSSDISLSGATLSGGAFASADIELPFNYLATCDVDDVSFIT